MNGHLMIENGSTRSPSTTAWSPPNNMFISHPDFLKEVSAVPVHNTYVYIYNRSSLSAQIQDMVELMVPSMKSGV